MRIARENAFVNSLGLFLFQFAQKDEPCPTHCGQCREAIILGCRFPPPWSIDEHPESFIVRDATGVALGHFYFDDEASRRSITEP